MPEDTLKYDWVGKHRRRIWGAAAVVALVLGYGMAPWDALTQVLQDKGAGDSTLVPLAFVGGYCAPAVAATAITIVAWANGSFQGPSGLAYSGLVFVAASLLASALTFGLPADFASTGSPGPPYVAIPLIAVRAYLNSYGLALFLAAVSIGAALSAEVLHYRERLSG